MPVFFPFGIPTTSSFATSAQTAITVDAPPGYTAPFAVRAIRGPAGSPGVNAVNCPPGYENALNPSNPGEFPPVPSQAIDRSGYLLCFPTSNLSPTPSATVTPSASPPVATSIPPATPTPQASPTPTPTVTPNACYQSAYQVRVNDGNLCGSTYPLTYIGTDNPTGNITTGGFVYYTDTTCTTLINATNYDDTGTIYLFNTNGTLSATTPCSL